MSARTPPFIHTQGRPCLKAANSLIRRSDARKNKKDGWVGLAAVLTFESGQDASPQRATGRREAQHDGARVGVVDLWCRVGAG